MEVNSKPWFLILFNMASITESFFLIHHNRMVNWRENTDTFSIWGSLFSTMIFYQCSAGVMLSSLPRFSSIHYPQRYSQVCILMNKLCQTPPDYSCVRVFCCLWFPFIRSFNKHKMDFRSPPCVFIGYCANQHGYRCLDSHGRVYVLRHVPFHETMFPFANKHTMFLTSSTPKNT